MKNLQKYIYKQEISTSLKEKVSKKVVQTFERDNRQKNCFEDLQSCLRKEQILEDFKKETLTHFVNQYDILSQFSVSTRQQIVSCLCSVSLNPNDTISLGSGNEEASMYLIKSGKVSIHQTDHTPSFYNLNQSQSFGEYAFFTGQSQRFLAKSLDYTILYTLRRDQFLKIISANPTDIEIAAYIRDQVLFNSNYSYLKKNCYYCNSNQHLVFTCPLIHFSKERTSFYDRYLYPHTQERKFVTRRIIIRKNTFLFLNRKNQISMKSISDSSSSSLTSSEEPSFTESLLMSSVFNQNLEIQSNQKKSNLRETLPIIPEDLSSSDIKLDAQNPKIIRLPSYKTEDEKQQLNNFRLNEPGAIIQKLMKGRKEQYEYSSSKSPQKSPIMYSPSCIPVTQNIEGNSAHTQSEMLLFTSQPSIEPMYIVDLDRGQDFDIYYPEFNIGPVLYKYSRRRWKDCLCERSRMTINFQLGMLISQILKRDN